MKAYAIETLFGQQSIRRRSDGASIPMDNGNQDYVEYLRWFSEGNLPDVVNLDALATLDDKRQAEYAKQGATTQALVVALWEQVVEDRPESAAALQAIREQVKLDIPKGV